MGGSDLLLLLIEAGLGLIIEFISGLILEVRSGLTLDGCWSGLLIKVGSGIETF